MFHKAQISFAGILFSLLLVFLFSFTAFGNSRAADNDSLQVFRKKVDSIYVEMHSQQLKGDKGALFQSIKHIDELVAPIENVFPWLSGMVQLHQAYYTGNREAGKPYFERALKNLKGVNAEYLLNNSGSFLWLIEGFHLENRQEEWEPADSLFRSVLNSERNFSPRFAVSHYAGLALQNKEYELVKNLAKYDEYYFRQFTNSEDKFYVVYVEWLQLKQSLEQWEASHNSAKENLRYQSEGGMVLPDVEVSNSGDIHFKSELKGLLKDLEDLHLELESKIDPSSEDYNEFLRKDYLRLHNYISEDLYTWAVTVQRQSEVVLPLKKYLFYQLPGELVKSGNARQVPVPESESVAQLVENLANLYYDIGNAEQANNVLMQGLHQIKGTFSEDAFLRAYTKLMPLQIRVKRLAGETETALEEVGLLKKYTPKPVNFSKESLQVFEAYAAVRIEEIYTLLSLKEREKAKDSLSSFLTEVESIVSDNEALFYETRAWIHLLFIGANIQAQKGHYKSDLASQLVSDMLRGEVSSEVFYPAQMLALKARFLEKGELDLEYLQNLLTYTERQLKYNSSFLSAEERMKLYSYRLNDIFDLYHQLLFEGKLEKHEDLKREVVAQSLYLKNVLSDGNLISDEMFSKGRIVLDSVNLTRLRNLNQVTKLSQQVGKLYKIEPEVLFDDRDLIQTTWMDLLEEGMKDLVKLEGIEEIRKKLKPGEAFIESIRYTRSLNDSTAVYGAYVITSKEFKILNICSESDLMNLLKQKNSSPQTFSVTHSAERGGIGKSLKKSRNTDDYKPGDPDLLGELLLKPLWPFIHEQSALLMAHDGLLNRISFAALQWEGTFLMDHFSLRQFSGSASIGAEDPSPSPGMKVLLAGGIDYGNQEEEKKLRLFKDSMEWDYLPGTMSEIEMLQPLFEKEGFHPEIWTGKRMSDVQSQQLGNFSIVHLATHGFYFDSSTADRLYHTYLSREAIKSEPFFRSGLAISNANNPSTATTLGTEGYLMGYELAGLDLRNCYLVSLSACETGLGDLRNNLGVDGLPRALKIAGAKNLLISLWKVPDAPTAEFMRQYYSNLFQGNSLAAALRETQKNMSKNYPASDWGAFILIE